MANDSAWAFSLIGEFFGQGQGCLNTSGCTGPWGMHLDESVHFSSLCMELPGLASFWQAREGDTLEQNVSFQGASHPAVACPALPCRVAGASVA